jgi:hypothetical protein
MLQWLAHCYYCHLLLCRFFGDVKPFHCHKFFGALALTSFGFRFCNFGGQQDMGFATHPMLTLPTILVHLSLNLTSLLFQIPKKRISHGGRIWPEYRLHSLVFTLRSHLTLLWYMYEQHYGLAPNYNFNYFIVMASTAASDLVTYSVAEKYRSNTVRGVSVLHPAAKFFISVMVIQATAGFLFGVRRMTIPFLTVFVLQITAFMGTLQRKNLIAHSGLFIFVALSIVTFSVQSYEYNRIGVHVNYSVRTLAAAVALLRLAPLPKLLAPIQSKYVIFTVAHVVLDRLRPHLHEIPLLYFQWKLSMLVLLLCIAGCYKMDYYNRPESVKEKTL